MNVAGTGITNRCHFFSGDPYLNYVNARCVACLNCASCRLGVFTAETVKKCSNLQMGGLLERCNVVLKSGARDEAPLTRYQVTELGVKKGWAVREQEIVGAECAHETEPYILFKVCHLG